MDPVHLIVVVDFDKDDTGTLCLRLIPLTPVTQYIVLLMKWPIRPNFGVKSAHSFLAQLLL